MAIAAQATTRVNPACFKRERFFIGGTMGTSGRDDTGGGGGFKAGACGTCGEGIAKGVLGGLILRIGFVN